MCVCVTRLLPALGFVFTFVDKRTGGGATLLPPAFTEFCCCRCFCCCCCCCWYRVSIGVSHFYDRPTEKPRSVGSRKKKPTTRTTTTATTATTATTTTFGKKKRREKVPERWRLGRKVKRDLSSMPSHSFLLSGNRRP